jgi:AhpD family alkylhydroperoxidase
MAPRALCLLPPPATFVSFRTIAVTSRTVCRRQNYAKEITMYDMKNLTKLKKLGELAPAAFQGFVAFDEAAFKEGAIPLKYKELIAVAVGLTTQCPYCIEIHSKKAKKAGATEQELAETTLIAAALRAGGAITHGTHALE